jgi:uncharacterized membrane protein
VLEFYDMNKHVRAFLAGLLLVIPFAVTLYVIWTVATWLGAIGIGIYDLYGPVPAGMIGKPHDFLGAGAKFGIACAGALVTLAAIYLVGLLTHTLLMGRLVRMAEALIQHVPGVKTIYQSIRDLLKLFGGGSKRMGKVVFYRPSGGEMGMLGILTNQNPVGLAGIPDHQLVAVYLPLAFMLGGQIVYVPRKYLQELSMPVEQALKICATAEVGPQDAPADTLASAASAKTPE